ncbi:YhgE/Pip domain-containing protein [Nocardioidaceae bacterium SCSIO 66511]|nr:YhgE/Pip domain-containing protein [Nocardioidaceae bacterium SCSIO 66511]
MSSLRMAFTELRRLFAGRLPRLAIGALILIPSMYAGLYLWANHDPYGNLDQVDAALVVADTGAKASDGTNLHVGRDVADDLVDDGSFRWHEVSAEEAEDGVRNGEYSFAVTLPKRFSAALASTADLDPQKGRLRLTTNDSNNYLAHSIGDQLMTRIAGTITERVGKRAASEFLAGFADVHSQVRKAGNGAAELRDGLADAVRGSRRLEKGAGTLANGEGRLVEGQERLAAGIGTADRGAKRLDSGAHRLADGLDTLARRTASLPRQTARLASGSRQVADGNRRIAAVADRAATISSAVMSTVDAAGQDIRTALRRMGLSPAQVQRVMRHLDRVRTPLERVNRKIHGAARDTDRLADGAQRVADGNRRLSKASGRLVSGIGTADRGATRLASGADRLVSGIDRLGSGSDRLVDAQRRAHKGARRLDTGAGRLVNGLVDARDGAGQLASGLRNGLESIPNLDKSDRKSAASAIASPVDVESVSQASAGSYGAGLAPFFMGLATWIGAYVVFLLVRPLSNRAIAARAWPARIALGGWIPPSLIGIVQVAVMLLIIAAVVGITIANTLQALLFLVLVTVTFVAIVHALNAWLGGVGQFVGLVLLVLQLVSAGGTFPWQTLPGPLQALHHVLPLSYAIDGLRHLMYGGPLTGVGRDVFVLCVFLAASLFATAVAARRQRMWTVSRIKPELAL